MTTLDRAEIDRIEAAVARPPDPAREARQAYVNDRKKAQSSLTRGLQSGGLKFGPAQRLAIAALQAVASHTMTPELEAQLPSRTVAKIVDRGREGNVALARAGDAATRVIADAARTMMIDPRLRAGVREIARQIVDYCKEPT